MPPYSGNVFVRIGLYVFLGVGILAFALDPGFADNDIPEKGLSEEQSSSPATSPDPSSPSPATPPPTSLLEKGQRELDALREKPEEFRTLITGVQIFLGRFGYGVGPYTGILDPTTKEALIAYQKHTGLSPTGELDFPTLKRLTEDDRLMNRVVPLLPPQRFQGQVWDQRVEVQGSWMLKEGNTDDVLQTSRITCMRELKRCFESTASLINAVVPQLKVHTYVYNIKDWDEDSIVSAPYEEETCAVSILRISRDPALVTRFVSLQKTPGACSQVKTEDRQYILEDGQKIYQMLRMQKANAIQDILQVSNPSR